MAAKNKGGRPTKKTDQTVSKLEYAFGIGCSIEEACLHADISRETYYDWSSKDEGFSDRMRLLRDKPALQARKVINDALIDGDASTAKWYMERKKSQEFSTQQDLGTAPESGGLGIQIIVDADKTNKSSE